MLEQRPADPLDDAAPDLLVHEERVEHGAAILDAPVLEERHEARLRVDLDIGGLTPLVKAKG